MKRTVTTVAACLAMSTAVLADDYDLYGEVEGWKVFADNTDNTCLIERVGADGVVVQMGISEADNSMMYVGVFIKAETDLKNNRKLDLKLNLDGDLYTGEAKTKTKRITDGYEGGYVLADNPNFIEDLAKKYTMVVTPEDREPFEVDLNGTYNAMSMAKECGEKLRS